MMRKMIGDLPILQNKASLNPDFLIIGDVKGRRVQAFTDCLKDFGITNYKVVAWLDIMKGISGFTKHIKDNTIVKIEPPEKDMEIYRGFLTLGAAEGLLTTQEIKEVDFSDCPIIAPRQWYEGFKMILNSLEAVQREQRVNSVFFMNDCTEILMMMDKSETYKALEAKVQNYEFYLPERLTDCKNYQEFKDRYGSTFIKCFIKLQYGSGGTGILAYSNHPKRLQETVFTSLNVETIQGKRIFYSNHKVNYYQDKEVIKILIDWVLLQGAHMEKWVPKSTYEGYSFDTRSFVIDKQSEYLVARLSKSPITNLHLGNRRVESDKILSKEQVAMISKASEDVMKIFHKSLYAGIDVVCSTGYKPYIVDVNPFGDLFHHLLGTDKNVYYAQIKKAITMLRGISDEG